MLTISELQAQALQGAVSAEVHAQVEGCLEKVTAAGKPYLELRLRDADGSMVLRSWSDAPSYEVASRLGEQAFVAVKGEFQNHEQFGLDSRRWELRELTADEQQALLGAANPSAEQAWEELSGMVREISDPRLRQVSERFLAEHGARFRRASAARQNHHAERGGLLRHTLQMMRSARALCSVYPDLNADLLSAGVLFHDCGKLWETCAPEDGFTIGRTMPGEMLGHITIGIELINHLWKQLPLGDWTSETPRSEEVRLHLLHLVASHHGEYAFGSPVLPKTPEAIALHFIDNLDAKLEMITKASATAPEVAPGIYDRVYPLPGTTVRALSRFAENTPVE